MSLPILSPEKAHPLLGSGAVLVDIREHDEHARERIPGARHHALSAIEINPPLGVTPVIFYCRSGNRTLTHAARLKAAAQGDAYILAGGIDAWKAAGLPVIADTRRPIELMRQVQIAAGSLVALGVALGVVVHPAFHALAAFVGVGLVFAGATGACGMARLLALAPWNRRWASSAA